ncbi:probable myosin light chain kinase DDB_G0275057 [Folsomia candida]|uniref:non-specific serine/threonine protein kinase n=1 Tax=Folsomia candida TaxID=158441 RepID=A0A226DT49_FOLCA|nr:probable myosin light chain kinase DDB_G0275057 [Folsomia candida]OXA47386.1 putative serine/threonine-protein kinase tsuA [Folsomia candida]
MDPVISFGDVRPVVKILEKDPIIFEDIVRVMGFLEIPFPDQNSLRNRFTMGMDTGYTLLSHILKKWISRNGNNATFLKLTEILEENMFLACADELKHEFGSRMAPPPDQLDNFILPVALPSQRPPIYLSSNSGAQSKKTEHLERLRKWKSYQVLSFLGAGSFGFVFKIRKTGTSEETAVKIVLDEFHHVDTAMGSDDIEATNTELKVMTELTRHENVVRLVSYDVLLPLDDASISGVFQTYGDAVNITNLKDAKLVGLYNSCNNLSNTKNTFVLEMELCGPTLREWLSLEETWKKYKDPSSNPAFLEEQMNIAQGIIAGLKHIHQKDMIHRDLKPENIYFARDGFVLPVKIGDFGLTRQMSGNASVTQTKPRGTEIYRAPEVYSGKYGQKADLFSLGIVLWEIFEIVPMNFDALRYRVEQLSIDQDFSVVKGNDKIPNLKDTIIGLTNRKLEERTQSIHDVKLYFIDQSYGSESDSVTSLLR